MSRFFATASDSESETSSSEEDIPQVPKAQFPAAFLMSDDEDDQKRIVRTAKEKRFEELNNIIRQLRNYKKIKDMSKMLSSFDDLLRAYLKALPVINKEEHGITPRFYIRCLCEMEDFVNEVWEDRDGRKNMSKNNSKSLATLRQKIRKYNRDFEEDMGKFRENPDIGDDDEVEYDDEGAESDVDDNVESFKKVSISKEESLSKSIKDENSRADEGSDDDSIDWGSDSESSSESESEAQHGYTVAYFLKRSGEKTEEERMRKKEKEKKKEERSMKRKKMEGLGPDEGEWTTVKGGAIPAEKPKMFAKDAEINHVVVLKKLHEIMAARGKKGTDRKEQIELLHELLQISDNHNLGPAMAVKINFAIVASIYDYNPAIAVAMKPDYWEKLICKINALLDMILDQENLIISENTPEENELLEKPPYRIRGCMLTVVERMDEEFTKILKDCDAHSTEYVDRLKDEVMVEQIINKLREYIFKTGSPSEICRVYLRVIEHVYYKFDPEVFKKKEGKETKHETTSLDIMDKLCKYIYAKDNTDRLRTRAILCHIYHHALHDNWYEARDLMLMSHLQDTIQHSDPPTQILYNRTMVQLGLCAFRHAHIKDAHNALLDIQSGGRAKELLAQGLLLQRQHERTSEQEKIEKQRQMPFHMHINLELLECVYLVSAMLMEIPYMAAHESDARRRLISKSFHHQLKVSERQALVGPPESMREHVVAAAKAMRNGNWRACRDFIINEKMDSKVWDLFYNMDQVKKMLTRKIQEESLRTYLFTHSSVYDSISLKVLSEMFELDISIVHSIISKMIINEELMASLDEPTQALVMHKTEPSRLQSLTLQLADKVAILVESNERIMEMKLGAYFARGNQPQGYRDRQQYGNRNTQQWSDRNRPRQERAY